MTSREQPTKETKHDENSINCTCLACWRADVKDQASRTVPTVVPLEPREAVLTLLVEKARHQIWDWWHKLKGDFGQASTQAFVAKEIQKVAESYSSHVNAALMSQLSTTQEALRRFKNSALGVMKFLTWSSLDARNTNVDQAYECEQTLHNEINEAERVLSPPTKLP